MGKTMRMLVTLTVALSVCGVTPAAQTTFGGI
jgi:hypothetical protein